MRRYGPADVDLLKHDIHVTVEHPDIKRFKRECADTLSADQIDEQRTMRAYADANALLDGMPHL